VALSESKATVFSHCVNNPKRYGILEFDGENRPVCIEEKPKQPKSNWAVTGLYFYDASIVDVVYLEAGRLRVQQLGRGFAWFEAGTHHSTRRPLNSST
jgi:glucose-1-phosphate thymidylyltransferase